MQDFSLIRQPPCAPLTMDAPNMEIVPHGTGKSVTMADVAAIAGVSPMTVSRVIRNIAMVSAKTRAKVDQAIEQTGYRPDPALSALVACRSKHGNRMAPPLAFIDCDRSDFSERILVGIRREAQMYGYSIEAYHLDQSKLSVKRLSSILYHRGVRGLMFGPTYVPTSFHGWDWDHFTTISLGVLTQSPPMNSVAIDYFDGAFSGYTLLKQQGSKRIGLAVSDLHNERTGNRWLGGYAAAVLSHADTLLIYRGSVFAGKTVKAWLRREHIDSILTLHDEIANVAKSVNGIRVAFLNDIGEKREQQTTYMAATPEIIGIEGIRVIHQLLLQRKYGLLRQPRTVSVRGEWIQ